MRRPVLRAAAIRLGLAAALAILGVASGATATAAEPIVDEVTRGAPAPPAAPRSPATPAPIDTTAITAGSPAAGDPAPLARDPMVPLGQVQRAWRQPVAAPGQTAPGQLLIEYVPQETMVVHTRRHMVTTIHLPTCETAQDIYLGDTYVFDVSHPRQDTLLVFPRLAGADTNLEVIGSTGAIYTFYLTSEDVDAGAVTDLSVRIHAPSLCLGPARPTTAGRPAATSRSTTADYLRTANVLDPAHLNCDRYRISYPTEPDREIAPERVCTDGQWVLIDYGVRADSIRWPTAYLTADGVDTPVNTRLLGDQGQILVVEAYGNITLKSGQRAVCLRLDHW